MSSVALDSNAVIALLNRKNSLHLATLDAVREWEVRSASFVLSTVAWTEVLTGALRAKGPSVERDLTAFREASIDDVVPVDVDIATAAARLRVRDRGLRTPDALIVATAQHVSADALLTADRKLKRVDRDLVQVVSA